MLNSRAKYGAVMTKVRAMYGKMLTQKDWQKLIFLRDPGEAASFLRSHPGYESIALGLKPGAPDFESLISAVKGCAGLEYGRVFMFASRMDRRFLLFAGYRTGAKVILTELRRLISGRGPESAGAQDPGFAGKNMVNVPALRAALDYNDLLSALEGGVFHAIVASAPRDPATGLPDYGAVSVLLDNGYYKAVYSFLDKKYSGPGNRRLTELIGTEADLLNIVGVLRLRRCFPGSLGSARDLLVPVRHRLTPALLDAIAGAPSEEAVSAMLRDSRWSSFFGDQDHMSPESMFEKAMDRFCRRLIRSPEPGICSAQAYLTLKEMEAARVARVLEAMRRGIDPAKVL